MKLTDFNIEEEVKIKEKSKRNLNIIYHLIFIFY